MGVGLLGIVCAAGLALLGVQVSPVVTAVLGLSSIWVPTALCWIAVYRVRLRRPEVLLAAAAVLAVVLDPLLAPALTGAHHAMGRSLHPDEAQ
jgi:F0F1-type ATP synthase assembly protein I